MSKAMSSQDNTTDTSAEAAAVQLELIRQMTPAERLEKTFRLSSQLLWNAKQAIRRQHPEFSERQVSLKFIELHYGAELAAAVGDCWREHHVG